MLKTVYEDISKRINIPTRGKYIDFTWMLAECPGPLVGDEGKLSK